MAIRTIAILKGWFSNFLKPPQQQFWDWLDSYRHKLDKIEYDDLSNEVKAMLDNIPDPALIQSLVDNTSGGGSTLFNGNRTITRDFTTLKGINLNSEDVNETLEKLLYPAEPPTSQLTLTYTYLGITAPVLELELMVAGATLAMVLNWVAGRLTTSPLIQTIDVAGVFQSFAQPAAPGTLNGMQAVNVVRNANIIYHNVVTTADGQSVTSQASVNWFAKKYWGFVTSDTPTDGNITALANEFAKDRTKGLTTVANTTDRKFCYAAPVSNDPTGIDKIFIGGIDSTAVFTRTVRALVNAAGYSQNYEIFVQQTSTSGEVSFEIM